MIVERKVMLLTGAGQVGMAISRRMGYRMKIVIGDKKPENDQAIAKTRNNAGFDIVPMEMDLSNRASLPNIIAEAQKYGSITMLVNAPGVSPSQAPIEAILKVDLVRECCSAGGGGQGDCPRRRGRDVLQPVRSSDETAGPGGRGTAGLHAHRGTSEIVSASAGKYPGYAAR